MYFSELPEDIVFVFAIALDLEFFKHGLVFNSLSVGHSGQELGLGLGARSVFINIGFDVHLGISLCFGGTVLKEPESAYQVLVVKVHSLVDASPRFPVLPRKFGEYSCLELGRDVEGGGESRELDWHSHPCLAEESISSGGSLLEGTELASGPHSNEGVENDLAP